MEKTLLVLAAGMGSRYGGLKQMEGFGPHGETILEYSLFDAYRSGFRRFVFVIRKSLMNDFAERILSRLPRYIKYEICFQELDFLPEGFEKPEQRTKPWGTGHAVWVAKGIISGPFAVVNADDFYGLNGFMQLAKHFDENLREHAMVAYPLGLTLSEHGTVSRGICHVGEGDRLLEIREVMGIRKERGGILSDSVSPVELHDDTLASMNLFGFQSSIYDLIEQDIHEFFQRYGEELKSEFYIPFVVNHILEIGSPAVRVFTSEDAWMGVTNTADRDKVVAGIRTLIDNGVYPESLWQ